MLFDIQIEEDAVFVQLLQENRSFLAKSIKSDMVAGPTETYQRHNLTQSIRCLDAIDTILDWLGEDEE